MAKIRNMKQSIFALSALLLGSLFAFAAPTPPAETAPVTTEQKRAEIDLMKMDRDARCKQVLVTCLVNGQAMRMILDTGATHTVLHEESAAKLKNAHWLDVTKIKFKGNSEQRPKMLIAALQVGPGVSPQHPVIVVSLAAVRSMMAEKVDGIVGMDILGSLPFTFDLRDNDCYWGYPAGMRPIPLRGERDPNGRLMMRVKSGDKESSLLLDTGSSVTRIRAKDWAPGIAGEISGQVGDIDTAAHLKLTEGKPGRLEAAPGIFLKEIKPLICDDADRTMLGMDALANTALVHIPSADENIPYGDFFLVSDAAPKSEKP